MPGLAYAPFLFLSLCWGFGGVRCLMKRLKPDRHDFLRTRVLREATAMALARRARPRELKSRARRDGPLIPVAVAT